MKVYFIGAGPGDPDLITVKGLKRLQECPVVIYAGSLIPVELVKQAQPSASIYDSATLTLPEIIQIIEDAKFAGQDVARLHCGDPSVYGAIGEQIRQLEERDIAYEVIPGVSATGASAALLGKELTLSGISQTVILTRYAGKTPMPERESLKNLAQHGATLAIHLGITRIHKIVDDLIPCYGEQCPVAVCYRTSWPDQDYVEGSLGDIVEKVRAKGFTRTALILVGPVLDAENFNDSYLYNDQQAHVFRPKAGQDTAKAAAYRKDIAEQFASQAVQESSQHESE